MQRVPKWNLLHQLPQAGGLHIGDPDVPEGYMIRVDDSRGELGDIDAARFDQHLPLTQVRAQVRAESERAPQVSALPDPTLSLGIQNDGFSGIQIGKMETSFLAVTASQTFPLAGKRGLRGDVAHLGARSAEVDLQRALLSAEADVERAYLDLLLVRDQLALLGKLESLWAQSEGLARARYEAGEGTQSDLLRSRCPKFHSWWNSATRRIKSSWATLHGERRNGPLAIRITKIRFAIMKQPQNIISKRFA